MESGRERGRERGGEREREREREGERIQQVGDGEGARGARMEGARVRA
jgi:hypothetical protein